MKNTKRVKGEITIFLTMLLGVVLIFIYALISSTSVALSKSYARGESEMAIASVFAEYHSVLWEEYHIFAVETTYETGSYSVDNIKERIAFYGDAEMEWEVEQLQFLSDQNGASYEEQILTYMKQKYGVEDWSGILGLSDDDWESQRSSGETVIQDGEEASSDIEAQLETLEEIEEEEFQLLDTLSFINQSNILDLVLTEEWECSEITVEGATLASNRDLQVGIDSYQLTTGSSLMNKLLVGEYMLEHFATATDESDDTTCLQYEIEYILAGKYSDEENLAEVVNQLVLLRTAVNYTSILQSPTKIAIANSCAITMAVALGNPLLEPVVEQLILISWSYGESILDVRSLLAGNGVPLVKTEADWQLGWDGLLTLGTAEDSLVGGDATDGLNYEAYLRILLYLEDKEEVIVRSLDLIEVRMQEEYELTYFQVDQCMTQIQYLQTTTIMGEYTYEFPVAFTYR